MIYDCIVTKEIFISNGNKEKNITTEQKKIEGILFEIAFGITYMLIFSSTFSIFFYIEINFF